MTTYVKPTLKTIAIIATLPLLATPFFGLPLVMIYEWVIKR